MWHLDPLKNKTRKIIDRSYEDRYNDPGSPMMEKNIFGRSVLALVGGKKNILCLGMVPLQMAIYHL